MESQRNLFLIGLLFVSFLLYQQWQFDQNPTPPAEPSALTQEVPTASSADVPRSAAVPTNTAAVSAAVITVSTDTLDVTIDTLGGDIVHADLPTHKVELDGEQSLTILSHNYSAQSGLIGAQGPDGQAQRPQYQASASHFSMTGDQLVVPLTYTTENGLQVEKRFIFHKGQYHITVEFVVTNHTGQNAHVQMYSQLKQLTTGTDEGSMFMPTYRGSAYSTADSRYEKYSFSDIASSNLNRTTQGGWIAMLQHYFVSAWVPDASSNNEIYSRSIGDVAIIGVKQPPVTIANDHSATLTAELYVGPKDQKALSALSDSLNLTVDYGWLWFIAEPLYALLIFLHGLVGNWGLAIILMTLVIRGVMYPLTKAQYTSMAKMRELQPKIQELKNRFGDDRQRMSQATMELYQKEKVNPMGGCLPMLLQFPIFIAFYWVLLESVELRHAPFFGWIHDLAAPDPYFVLPILMGISMFAMQKLSPPAPGMDPMQQKIMQYLPVAFTVFFLWFPAGLVLYWLVGNLVAIAQQLIIYKGLEKQGLK